MKVGHPEICLVHPEIPQNTGSVGRLAAATQSRLHLIRPFGFSASDRNLLRPGLDYWPYLDLEIHDCYEDLLTRFPRGGLAFFSKKASRSYLEMGSDTSLLIFGCETRGLPADLFERFADRFFCLPMFHERVRSLNLANTVAVVVYHQLARSYGDRNRFSTASGRVI